MITPDDVKSMKAGESYTVDGTHAHAWVEYYQDGVGWLPFESTPSYLGIMETAEDYQVSRELLRVSEQMTSRNSRMNRIILKTKNNRKKRKMRLTGF